MHIAVAGNIGSGKTTLANMLAQHYGWTVQSEPVVDNPYLEDYYADIPRWAFNVEVFFLKERFKNVLEIAKNKGANIIEDRTIFEGAYVFATNNFAQGQLSLRDYTTYMELFSQISSTIEQPDLLIYIRSSIPNLVAQITHRGREYEKSISTSYLQGLNDLYEKWVGNYSGRLFVVDGDRYKFESDPTAFKYIIDHVEAELHNR